MANTVYTLQNPAFFDFTNLQGTACRGADQMWYTDLWQQRAGCGPTTAATCLSYLAQQQPKLAGLDTIRSHRARDFAGYMAQVWTHVTPTRKGLNSLPLYYDGCISFAAARGIRLSHRALEIPGRSCFGRVDFAACADFVRRALSEDLPLAFLNFSNGALTNLDSWHWVPLIAAEDRPTGEFLCQILDEGFEKTIDLALWHKSSYLGGGLVCLLSEETFDECT